MIVPGRSTSMVGVQLTSLNELAYAHGVSIIFGSEDSQVIVKREIALSLECVRTGIPFNQSECHLISDKP